MRKTIILLALIGMTISCIRVNENPSTGANISDVAQKDGIFIHVKQGSENAHEVLMALSMASKFAADYDVLMYFDIDGIDMVTKDAPNLEMDPFGTSNELFNKLVAEGVTIFACPGCMKVHDIEANDLRGGVTVADKDEFFGFTEGRILSIDY